MSSMVHARLTAEKNAPESDSARWTASRGFGSATRRRSKRDGPSASRVQSAYVSSSTNTTP